MSVRISGREFSEEELENEVIVAISEVLDRKKKEIKKGMRLAEDLGADSLDRIEMVMELEDRFGLSISDGEAKKLTTVELAIDYVRANLKKD